MDSEEDAVAPTIVAGGGEGTDRPHAAIDAGSQQRDAASGRRGGGVTGRDAPGEPGESVEIRAFAPRGMIPFDSAN
jgi:hypothetical protein